MPIAVTRDQNLGKDTFAVRCLPCTIKRVAADGRGGAKVLKKHLVDVVHTALRAHRVEVAASLPQASILVRELQILDGSVR